MDGKKFAVYLESRNRTGFALLLVLDDGALRALSSLWRAAEVLGHQEVLLAGLSLERLGARLIRRSSGFMGQGDLTGGGRPLPVRLPDPAALRALDKPFEVPVKFVLSIKDGVLSWRARGQDPASHEVYELPADYLGAWLSRDEPPEDGGWS